MGYDVTFHPVSARELQYFVFDVLDDPTLLTARMAEVTDDKETRAIVHEMFEKTLEVDVAALNAGRPGRATYGISVSRNTANDASQCSPS